MAAASSVQPVGMHALVQENSPFQDCASPGESRQDEQTASEDPSLRALPSLESEEIERRLEKTHKELINRRKILIKNLPQDATSQEVYDLLRGYELKYCYVDKNKGTAFVTLLNGEQAQEAIGSLHQSGVRGREISVQLQPTDALLCVTNLPHTFTPAQFEELTRAHGSTERSFLVYSERTGQPKGYGFVEYMKKDSASRARSELLGRRLAGRALMAQWTDVNQLTADHLHSKCLCVDRLPLDFSDADELARVFGDRHSPIFCQLAGDESSPVRGLAVVEYETAEQAEVVLLEMDRQLIAGREVRVSFCAPGTSGRNTLAALIAAQGVMSNNKKGLLPEPSLAQLLNSFRNPVVRRALMRSQQGSSKHAGKFQMQGFPFLQPPIAVALLQLGKMQQNALMGNGPALQNFLQIQMAQQQLLHIQDNGMKSVPSLLGDPPRALLQRVSTSGALGKGLLGDSPNEPSAQGKVPASGTGLMPYPPGRQQHLGALSSSELNGTASTVERQPGPPGAAKVLSSVSGPLLAGAGPLSWHGTGTGDGKASSTTSLLGEPPKDVKLPSNPYLNLASVLPSMVLQAPAGGKPQGLLPHSGLYSGVAFATQGASPTTAHLYSADSSADCGQQYSQQYTQEAMQQWYQHYQAQSYSSAAQEGTVSDRVKEPVQGTSGTSYGDYNTYMQAANQYYSQTHLSPAAVQNYHHSDTSKEADVSKTPHPASNGSSQLGSVGAAYALGHSGVQQAPTDWNQYYYNQARGQKRDFPQYPDLPSEVPCVGQYSQGLGGLYSDCYKKKRI